jgi:hypothetical protein
VTIGKPQAIAIRKVRPKPSWSVDETYTSASTKSWNFSSSVTPSPEKNSCRQGQIGCVLLQLTPLGSIAYNQQPDVSMVQLGYHANKQMHGFARNKATNGDSKKSSGAR